MSSTPSNRAHNAKLKLTPSNYQCSRNVRSPNRQRSLYESGLSLQRIIGTTVSSPTAFDTLSSPHIFAYTAGATVVVVSTDENSKYAQRYFRARPTATSNFATSLSPTTSLVASNDGKSRITGGPSRDTTLSYSLVNSHPNSDWGDSSTSKTWTSRERIKATTCLSLSKDGKFLAVGETGYAPRVLIFSLNEDSSDSPLVIINEHTFGVRAVAFSPDSRYLASLGNTHDGFLNIWSINQKTGTAKLYSSNKCTSVVKQMIWLGDEKIVTVGTRHIKIWRITENQKNETPAKPKYTTDGTQNPNFSQPFMRTLAGRNVLLGSLIDVTFTALAAISDQRAIVCSEKGDICLVDGNRAYKLLKLTRTSISITCIAVDLESQRVQIAGKNGKRISLSLNDLLSPNTPPTSPTPVDESQMCASGHICAMGYTGRRLVTVDTNHSIKISRVDSYSSDPEMQSIPFSAHSDAVLGVCMIEDNPLNSEFLTWSANGTIMFWDLKGNSQGSINIALQQPLCFEEEAENQCLNIRVSKRAEYLVCGDRYGVVKIIRLSGQDLLFETRAHSSDINDIDLFEASNETLLATCGRDRTVQLYRHVSERWVLVQTLNDHSASVTGLSIAENGEKLISSSTDRTVHIRQIAKRKNKDNENIVVLPLRIITLKASPVSITPYFTEKVSHIIISLLDRTVATYEISSGRLVMSFKASDNDSIEAVALDSLKVSNRYLNSGRPRILAGVSSTDKSVRIYDCNTGIFLDREWGHSSNVTDVAIYEHHNSDQKTIISTGSDGTIMIWSLSPKQSTLFDNNTGNSYSDDISLKETPPNSQMPIRRVLSKAELSDIQKETGITQSSSAKSPSRNFRKKSSRHAASHQGTPQQPMTNLAPKANIHVTDDSSANPYHSRARSRSPLSSPKISSVRRSSTTSTIDTKKEKNSSQALRDFGTLNMATEQACRTLRAYRKRLLSSESINNSSLKKLDQELWLTAVALGEKCQQSQIIKESALTGLLDQYSERLVSMFDEKLRLSRLASNDNISDEAECFKSKSSNSVVTGGKLSSSNFD
ncbi:Mitogen-activated protein kinase-binding protein 1 [Golovinomyces cichoracearum]|uniref:Mitogen-activated protein kinase-binding protein 1 n=1 Tax=Golovinomyces cichoracearum TaxID=62708 RepID=A0A420IKV9_9PEZI|nr:Mitogen-activated protein kinase-binding protein 1 [Golovinomyces cichoracearum]